MPQTHYNNSAPSAHARKQARYTFAVGSAYRGGDHILKRNKWQRAEGTDHHPTGT